MKIKLEANVTQCFVLESLSKDDANSNDNT